MSDRGGSDPSSKAGRASPRRTLLILAGVAGGLPGLAAFLVHRATDHALVPALARASGAVVAIGAAELDLTGELRLDDLALGDTITARSIRAGIGLGALSSGRVGADEIRLIGPRLRGTVRHGKLELGALAPLLERRRTQRRAAEVARAEGHGRGGSKPARPRRILAEDGEVVLDVEGHGRLEARGLELHPEAGGVRVIARELVLVVTERGVTARARFARSALDLALPSAIPRRAALAEGTVTIEGGGTSLAFTDAALVRNAKDGGVETRLEAHGPAGSVVRAWLTEAGGVQTLRVELPMLPLDALAPASPAHLVVVGAQAQVRAELRHEAGTLTVDTRIDLAGAKVQHSLLASQPVPLEGVLEARGTLGPAAAPAQGRRWDGIVTLAHGELGLEVAGTIEQRAGDLALALRLALRPVACAALLAAVPRELRLPLDGLELSGMIAGTADVAIDRSAIEATRLAFALDLGCKVVREPERADATTLLGPYEHTVPSTGRRRMAPGGNGFVPLKGLPSHVPAAFVAGEDARFYAHTGFDPIELQRSLAIDVAAGRVERGGSTISQQLVKNLWLPRERTIARKLLEAVLTWRVESTVPKQRILEVYLNLVELGEGVHGIGPSARRWFDVEPKQLTPAQAAFLAALTPAPVSTDRRLRAAGGMDDLMRRRVRAVLGSMRVNRFLSPEAYRAAIGERLEPRLAPLVK